MKIGSIQSFYGYNKNLNKNNHNKAHSLAFKADIRIVQKGFYESQMPNDHFNQIKESLIYAKEKYKNIGSDNLLIVLQPYTDDDKNPKKIRSHINIKALYKDPERAREEILAYRKSNIDTKDYEATSLLENRDPDVMRALSEAIEIENTFSPDDYIDKLKVATPATIDQTLDELIETMSEDVYTRTKDPIKRLISGEIEDTIIPIGGW